MIESDGSTFVLRRQRWKHIALIAVAAGFVAMALANLGVLGESPLRRDPEASGRIFIWFVAFFFGALCLKLVHLFVKDLPVASFDSDGIRLGEGASIPWKRICYAAGYTQWDTYTWPLGRGRQFLIFDVDPEWEVDLPFYKVWWHNLNRGYSGTSHSISPVATGFSLDYIVARFNDYAPERLRISND